MVRATFAGFTTALTSLQANQARLNIVGQNLSNMNTEGYTRQQLDTSSLNYTNPTSFYMNSNDVNIGFGVAMTGTSQVRDQFLDVQYRTQNAKTGYNDQIDEGLTALSEYLDETSFEGLRDSFDNIQRDLTNMQDASKVNDPVYEGQLRSDMEATTTLFNSTAESIKNAEINEVQNITGEGSNENGQVQIINNYLKQIGELNDQIKRNEMVGNDVLELKDERNLAIDKLSELIPVKVTYFNEKEGTGENWPDDLKLELEYTTTTKEGATGTGYITLVNGSNIGLGRTTERNYGEVAALNAEGTEFRISEDDPTSISLRFYSAANTSENIARNAGKADADKTYSAIDTGKDEKDTNYRISGKTQASLDLLAPASESMDNGSVYRSYDYYMNRLDALAREFSYTMNSLNYQGSTGDYTTKMGIDDLTEPQTSVQGKDTTYLLLVNDGSQDDKDAGENNAQKASNITAANISIAKNWVSGNTKIGTYANEKEENSAVDNVLNMLQAMTDSRDYNSRGINSNATGKRTFADEMNSISTYLANDKSLNARAYDTNTAVLKSISDSKDQLSGVSLDEEATNMMTYVSAYSAAAKLMSALDDTLQTLLGIAG